MDIYHDALFNPKNEAVAKEFAAAIKKPAKPKKSMPLNADWLQRARENGLM